MIEEESESRTAQAKWVYGPTMTAREISVKLDPLNEYPMALRHLLVERKSRSPATRIEWISMRP